MMARAKERICFEIYQAVVVDRLIISGSHALDPTNIIGG
jgi:hypothetical protein